MNNAVENSEKRNRIKRLIKNIVLLAIIAAAFVFLFCINHPVPCMFHKVTGLLCPGCGVTRMFMSLFRGDIKAAWGYNPMAMIILPILAVILVRMSIRYVKTGNMNTTKVEERIVYVMIVAILVFGVVRNLI